MTVRKVLYWAVRVIALALTVKFALWAYDSYRAGSREPEQQEVLDIDKQCLMDADTGFCICRHRWTHEHLDVSREECISRASSR